MANPRGFCAGVDHAISIVDQILITYGAPVYVRHEIVHNSYVIESFRNRGVIFVNCMDQVPNDAVFIISAHGAPRSVFREAQRRNLILFDATCPLVSKIHKDVIRANHEGVEIIFVGHAGHPEVEGTVGQYNNSVGGIYLVESVKDVECLNVKDTSNLRFITQTTLSIKDTDNIIYALREKFPNIKGPKNNNICYATKNRQEAVFNLAKYSDVVFVIGSRNSSNSNRLFELVCDMQKKAYLIDNADAIRHSWIDGIKVIGITAGASAPSILVNELIQKIKILSSNEVIVKEMVGPKEKIIFRTSKRLSIK